MRQFSAYFIPNSLTTLRVIAGVFIAWLWYTGATSVFGRDVATVAFVVALLAFATDYLDGRIAKWLGGTSRAGEFYDPLADKVVCWGYGLYLLPTFEHSPGVAVAAWAIALYDIISMAAKLSGLIGSPNIPAKIKTAMLMTGLSFIGGYHADVRILPHEFETGLVLLWGVLILSFLSASMYATEIGRQFFDRRTSTA